MVNFEKTPRTAIDEALTRGDSLPFSREILTRIQSQNLQYAYTNAERLRLKIIKERQREAQKRQKAIFQKVDTLNTKFKLINLDLADKLSKVIPYSLIPVIPIVVGYFLIRSRK